MGKPTEKPRDRWRRDPVGFIREVLIDPEACRPFELYAEQVTFLRHAFMFTSEGRMRFTELCFSAGKKSGKTSLAAMIVIFTAVVLAGSGGEIYCLANDLEQSASRVFKAVANILKASPLLRDEVEITSNRITFKRTGTFIAAVSNDFAGFSGANPTLNVYDELAYFASESSRRLWDEGVPSPARKISFRLSVSTAGFEGEPSPLRDIYDRAMEHGEAIATDLRVHENLLCYWTHEMRAPWQRPGWVAEMRRTLRPPQFARLILNQWTSSESAFISLDEWDAIVDPNLKPTLVSTELPIWAALDLGLRHDSTALLAVAWDGGMIRLVTHTVFVPREGQTLDVEATAQAAILSLRSRFRLISCVFDPWQFLGPSQTLIKQGVKMEELSQTPGNLTAMAQNLIDLIRRHQFTAYPSPELREAVSKTVAIESSRGMRLGKTKASYRVDPIIALAMACLVCVQASSVVLSESDREFMARANSTLHAQAQAARASLPGSVVQDRGGGLRIVNGAYDYKYRELPPDDCEGSMASVRRGRFGGRATW